jgi:hypothetical protein
VIHAKILPRLEATEVMSAPGSIGNFPRSSDRGPIEAMRRGYPQPQIRPYQYFSNKDDIVWAIVSDLFGEGTAHAKESIEGATTALSKITALLDFMADEPCERLSQSSIHGAVRCLVRTKLACRTPSHAGSANQSSGFPILQEPDPRGHLGTVLSAAIWTLILRCMPY